MSREEASVLIARLQQTAADLRDMHEHRDTPQHIVISTGQNLNALDEAIRVIAETWKVTA